MEHSKKLEKFLEVIEKSNETLKFEIVEIGAHPYGKQREPFHILLDFFPDSKIHAFEVDKNECDKLNELTKEGLRFHPYALGDKEEKRKFYQTNHPMCSSLYEPNEKLLRLYNNLDVAYLKKITEIKTITLDSFIIKEKIDSIDFIKIDIQGAELDVFRGAEKSLKDVLTIISGPVTNNITAFREALNKFETIKSEYLNIYNNVNHANIFAKIINKVKIND